MAAGRLVTLNDLTATHKPVLYNSATNRANPNTDADVPWIKNEELILLRAEIRWFTNNKPGVISDIDLIRTASGGLAPSTLTPASPDADFITELLYNRTYSLLWEQGTRWIDAQRYNRVGPNDGAVRGGAPGVLALPIDRQGDRVHTQMMVPAGECNARRLDVPVSSDVGPPLEDETGAHRAPVSRFGNRRLLRRDRHRPDVATTITRRHSPSCGIPAAWARTRSGPVRSGPARLP